MYEICKAHITLSLGMTLTRLYTSILPHETNKHTKKKQTNKKSLTNTFVCQSSDS